MYRVLRHAAFAVLLLTAACANNDYASIAARTQAFAAGDLSPLQNHRVGAVEVAFAPGVKTLWCGERAFDCGDADRHIAAMFREGALTGAAVLKGPQTATLKITVTEFESITSLQRVATGGIHYAGAVFQLFGQDAAPLTPPTTLDFDLIALGRAAAVIANMRGRTQRVRVTERIANVTKTWLKTLTQGVEEASAATAAKKRL